jgi:exodeoxyribonuclease VII small subunit
MTTPPPTPAVSFEQALMQLETLVRDIESGKVPLEESIAKYEQGTKLLQQCRGILDRAEQQIRLLSQSENGQLTENGQLAPEGE